MPSLDLEEMEGISPFRKRCIIPMLGLIENSLYENALLHNLLCMLLQLLNACPKLADILLDHGLLYVLFNTLSTLNGMENGYAPPPHPTPPTPPPTHTHTHTHTHT